MARAHAVRGIKPSGGLRENGQRVVAVRLDELLSWRSALDDPILVQDLHDLRIAAKRLRYALEMFEICFPDLRPVLKELSEMQDDVGEIHDFDVLIDILRARLREIDSALEGSAVTIMGDEISSKEKSDKLRQVLFAQARDQRRLGLIGLIGDKVAERERRFGAFQQRWGGAALDELQLRILQAVGLVTSQADQTENTVTENVS